MAGIDIFTRENYKKILEKIPTEGIVRASVFYFTKRVKEVPDRWISDNITQEEISFFPNSKTDTICPLSILDFPVITPSCANIIKILIMTNDYKYIIDPITLRIYGPSMPFTPDDLVAEGVRLSPTRFIYKWVPKGSPDLWRE